jgi:hypothetical protein
MLAALAAFFLGQPQTDPVSVRFAFFGCNRVDKEDLSRYASSANEPQLLQNLKDVKSLPNPPDYLFLTGDIVMGYANDHGQVLRKQLTAWNAVVKQVPFEKTQLIPMPGNHEMNRKEGELKLSSTHTIKVWNEWYRLSGYPVLSTNGPKDTDEALQDQSNLSYSFDRENVHFVVLNTDSLTALKDPKSGTGRIGWVPLEWIKKDLAEAEANSKITSVFLLGHRNLLDPADSVGDAPIDPEVGKKLTALLESTSKFRGFLCAHVHSWDLKPFSSKTGYQVIAGNGGSRLEKNWNPSTGQYFGFSVIEVSREGRVVLENYRRPVPKAPHGYADDCPEAHVSAVPVRTVLYDPKK